MIRINKKEYLRCTVEPAGSQGKPNLESESFSSLMLRRLGIAFGDLTQAQQSRLHDLIRKSSTN